MVFRTARTLVEAQQVLKHKHRWKLDPKDPKGVRQFCTRCGMGIVPAAAEVSRDCNHAWSVDKAGLAICLSCGYVARGKDHRRWWRKYHRLDPLARPRCLCCREPVMEYGEVCENCRDLML